MIKEIINVLKRGFLAVGRDELFTHLSALFARYHCTETTMVNIVKRKIIKYVINVNCFFEK